MYLVCECVFLPTRWRNFLRFFRKINELFSRYLAKRQGDVAKHSVFLVNLRDDRRVVISTFLRSLRYTIYTKIGVDKHTFAITNFNNKICVIYLKFVSRDFYLTIYDTICSNIIINVYLNLMRPIRSRRVLSRTRKWYTCAKWINIRSIYTFSQCEHK